MNDAPRYLNYAANLSGGLYFDPLNFWYISYVFFVAFIKLFFESNTYLIFGQYLFGYVGVIALFSATRRFTGNIKLAFLAGLVFILFPDNLMWHSYVLTESFYSSMICITLYFLTLVYQNPTRSNYIKLGFVLLIVFFSKPTSPALFIALVGPQLYRFLIDPSRRLIKVFGVVIVCALFMVLANKMISKHAVLLIYAKGDIVFAMHEVPHHPNYELLSIDIPPDLYLPDEEKPLLVQAGNFIINNPWYYTKLFMSKMLLFVTHVRPFWSWPHNLAIIVFLWTCYAFCFLTIKRKLISRSIAFSVIMYFCIHTILIGNTWVDWDGRFFVPLVPVIVMIASIGMANTFKFIDTTKKE